MSKSKDFFSDLSLSEIIQIIKDLWKVNLVPDVSALGRLYELEQDGEDVEKAIMGLCEGRVLKKYTLFKEALKRPSLPAPSSFSDSGDHFFREGSRAEHEFFQAFSENGGFDSFQGKENETIFERIYALHKNGCPVFTMMYEAERSDVASAYKEYLFARDSMLPERYYPDPKPLFGPKTQDVVDVMHLLLQSGLGANPIFYQSTELINLIQMEHSLARMKRLEG